MACETVVGVAVEISPTCVQADSGHLALPEVKIKKDLFNDNLLVPQYMRRKRHNYATFKIIKSSMSHGLRARNFSKFPQYLKDYM